MFQPFPFPPPPGTSVTPVWTGDGFALGTRVQRILSYEVGASGWSSELTEFHEDADDEFHYINVASRENALSRLERWTEAPAPVILDIGCSSGYTIKAIRSRLPNAGVMGADYVSGPLEKLGTIVPDVPLLQFDLTRCPLPDCCVDTAVLLNVLEHIEDDEAAIRQVHRILRPGGIAVIEVPAGPSLFDIYDRQLLHCRRYRMPDLLAKLGRAGFATLERSHLGFFLYPAFWVVKKRNRRYLQASREIQRALILKNIRQSSNSPFLHAIMRMESRLRDRIYLPFGIRCVVTCRRTTPQGSFQS